MRPTIFTLLLLIASSALAAGGESEALRFVFEQTPEGRLIAERMASRRIPAPEARELEQRLARIEREAQAFAPQAREAALRELAARELRIDAALGVNRIRFLDTPAALSPREAFLNGGRLAERLSVAAVQYPIANGRSLPELFAKMESYVATARAGGAQVVVFPELHMLDLVSYAQGAASEAEQLARIAREDTPRIFDHVAELSRRYGVAVLGGSSPRSTPKGIVNTAILAFPDGRRVLQDKLFLTPDEVTWGWVAGDELHVFDAPWGRSTILICYDSQFSTVSSAIGAAAPEVIFVPSMTGPKGFHRVRWAAQARAVEQHAYVVVTGTVTPANPVEHTAQAAILTPQDNGFPGTLVQGPKNRDALVFGALDLKKLRASRAGAGLYSARDAAQRGAPIRIIRE